MPRFDLASMTRRAKPNLRRPSIVLPDIAPPSTLATNLHRAAYRPVIDVWTATIPAIVSQYERTLAQMVTDSPADVKAEIDGAAEQISRILLLLTPEVRRWALNVEQWHRGKWRGAVLSATGVDLQTMIGAEDVRGSLDTAIAWNTGLIRDVSDQTRQRIGNAVFDGLRNRTPARDVAKSIREAVGMGRDRSRRVASDQLNKLTSALADERRREAGIDTWRWRHSGKLHPRANHKARDGNEYTDATAPEDLPGQLPYCGCRSVAVLKFD